jgi:hypothetical protein
VTRILGWLFGSRPPDGPDPPDEAQWEPVFRVIRVDDLPWPHNPFKCSYADRFESILDGLDEGDAQSADLEQVAGHRFLESLTDEQIDACERHQADWRAIADEAVLIVEAGGTSDDFVAAVGDSPLPESDRAELGWLLLRPIVIEGGDYTDGQHRACAIRFSGAQRVPVVIDWIRVTPSGR